jgi:hypothetical protein
MEPNLSSPVWPLEDFSEDFFVHERVSQVFVVVLGTFQKPNVVTPNLCKKRAIVQACIYDRYAEPAPTASLI